MLKTTVDEEYFMNCLFRNPSYVHLFDDLTNQDFTDDAWMIINAMRTIDYDELRDTAGLNIWNKYRLSMGKENLDHLLDIICDTIIPWQLSQALYMYQSIKQKKLEREFIHDLNNLGHNQALLTLESKIEEMKRIVTKNEDQFTDAISGLAVSEISLDKIQDVGLRTGFQSIDNSVVVEPNMLIIIAARAFVGKTTFSCQLAMNNSRVGKILYLSMEMSASQIKRKLTHYGPFFNHDNLFISTPRKLTLNMLSRTMASNKYKAIYIDQFNKITSDEGDTEYSRFTHVARKLKLLCIEHQTPIFCNAQLNRTTDDKSPKTYNLKGSGSLEEEADVIFLLSRPMTGQKELTHCEVAKNRSKNNFLKTIKLEYNSDINQFNEK